MSLFYATVSSSDDVLQNWTTFVADFINDDEVNEIRITDVSAFTHWSKCQGIVGDGIKMQIDRHTFLAPVLVRRRMKPELALNAVKVTALTESHTVQIQSLLGWACLGYIGLGFIDIHCVP